MSLTIKDFVKHGLNEDITLKKREIRCIKKEIKYIENMKILADNTTETDFKKLIESDKEMLEKYEKMSGLVYEKNKKEITQMVKDGKLKEVLLDERGKIIEGNEDLSGGSEQLSSVNKDDNRGREES